jgi:hypothetical protein
MQLRNILQESGDVQQHAFWLENIIFKISLLFYVPNVYTLPNTTPTLMVATFLAFEILELDIPYMYAKYREYLVSRHVLSLLLTFLHTVLYYIFHSVRTGDCRLHYNLLAKSDQSKQGSMFLRFRHNMNLSITEVLMTLSQQGLRMNGIPTRNDLILQRLMSDYHATIAAVSSVILT